LHLFLPTGVQLVFGAEWRLVHLQGYDVLVREPNP
jgi:hypothetical protein